MYEWLTTYCRYSFESQSQVKVTDLKYSVSKADGGLFASVSDSIDVSDQNRVYTLAALEAVPSHVMTKWVTDALGSDGVKSIEDTIDARIAEQKTPTSGGFVPDGDGAGTLPV